MLTLSDVVDLKVLQDMQDAFSEVTKLAIIIVDFQGNPITKYSNFTPHCQLMRNYNFCEKLCIESDAVGGLKATRKSKPYIYKCYSGLVDMAIPIIFEGHMLGSILAGQVRVEDSPYPENTISNQYEEINYFLEQPKRVELFRKTPTLTTDQVEKASKMIHVFCNYIIEITISKATQTKLEKKNNELKHEMSERLEMEKRLREAEVKILKSQVNPHFLFNILNNLKNLAIIENAPRTSEMVYTFTDMLRYTMGEIDGTATLGDEISYTLSYLKIQKMRFGDNLSYTYELDERLYNLKCPFLIIQPLVANAIDHGIFKKRSKGSVDIKVYQDKDRAIIKVTDDGVGMDPNIINKIQTTMAMQMDSDIGMGIGLININRRLQYEYGENWGLKFDSLDGAYTSVYIEIPLEGEGYDKYSVS